MNTIIDFLNAISWGDILICGLLAAGVYFSVRLGFQQIVHFGEMFRVVLARDKTDDKEGISPVQALCTSLASRVGTGMLRKSEPMIVDRQHPALDVLRECQAGLFGGGVGLGSQAIGEPIGLSDRRLRRARRVRRQSYHCLDTPRVRQRASAALSVSIPDSASGLPCSVVMILAILSARSTEPAPLDEAPLPGQRRWSCARPRSQPLLPTEHRRDPSGQHWQPCR